MAARRRSLRPNVATSGAINFVSSEMLFFQSRALHSMSNEYT
jgi:hypothetical protein